MLDFVGKSWNWVWKSWNWVSHGTGSGGLSHLMLLLGQISQKLTQKGIFYPSVLLVNTSVSIANPYSRVDTVT